VSGSLDSLVRSVRQCRICEDALPQGPRPIVQLSQKAKVLIAGQAPGRRVHASGKPFDDASGERLRDWMSVSRETFYDPSQVAILPMSFCYPGTGKSGDLPPRPECPPAWRHQLLAALPDIKLTLVIGLYAQRWHLEAQGRNLTETVRAWQDYGPAFMPLPHPSPRNNIWLSRNPWFSESLLPRLKIATRDALEQ